MEKLKLEEIDKNFLQELVYNSTSICEVLKKLGFSGKGGSHQKLKKFLKKNNFDTITLVGRALNKGTIKGQFKRRKLSEILVKNGTGNSNALRNRLLNEGVKEYKCECCGITEWNGKYIQLQLYHINGNHFDNRLENLIILCPNCHSQTTNWCGKNTEKKIDREHLNEMLKIIAEKNVDTKYQELLKREEKREKEVYLNKIKYGKISKNVRKPKEKKYCLQCGKEIKGRGKKFCSNSCVQLYNLKNSYNKETLLEQSKTVHSFAELGKLYNITDNAIKKHLKKFNILEEVKENFLSYSKKVEQCDLSGNVIKTWKNCKEAADALDIGKQNIISVCNNTQKTAGGYIWRYIIG